MIFLGHNALKIIIKINSMIQNFPETKKGLRFLALNIWPLWKAFDYGQPWLYTEYYSEYGILSLF